MAEAVKYYTDSEVTLMDMLSIIQEFGFPIAVTVVCIWFIWRMWSANQKQTEVREEKLYRFINQYRQQLTDAQKTNEGFVEILKQHNIILRTIQNDIEDIKTGGTK